jgi:hypothetical protein
MYELSLRIIYLSAMRNERSEAIIPKLWDALLGEAYDKNLKTLDTVIEKVRYLGSMFYPDDHVFPLSLF